MWLLSFMNASEADNGDLLWIFCTDNVIEFSWEPKGERFAIVSSNDPNLGNPGAGITIKTEVSFYQLERGKGDFKLLSPFSSITSLLDVPDMVSSFRVAPSANE